MHNGIIRHVLSCYTFARAVRLAGAENLGIAAILNWGLREKGLKSIGECSGWSGRMDHSKGADALGAAPALSKKQRDVLDLIADRRTNKEIAYFLKISESAVEQRLQSARQRLGATSRAEAARFYAQLDHTCGFPTGEKLQLPLSPASSDSSAMDESSIGAMSLADSMVLNMPAPWTEQTGQASVLEALDARFGKSGRLLLIIALAALMAIILSALLAIANALDTIF